MADTPIPKEINGQPTRVAGEPLQVSGETWVTLIADGDDGLWEFSLTTGRLIRTAEASDDEDADWPMAEHKVRVEGGLPGIRTGKRVPAVATCSCGAVGRGATRKAAVKAIKHNES